MNGYRPFAPNASIAQSRSFLPSQVQLCIEVMQICDKTKKRPFDNLFMRQTGSSKICCVRRNRSVKNRPRDIMRRWNSPPAVMSNAPGRLSGATTVSPRDSGGKQAGSAQPGDHDQWQAYAQPAYIATDIF